MKKRKYMNRGVENGESDNSDHDPMSGVANLFDVAMIFALGLMVMLLMYMSVPEFLTQQDITIVKNPGQPNMEVIVKNGEEIEKLDMSNDTVKTEIRGEMGRIYKTNDGGMIYIPVDMAG